MLRPEEAWWGDGKKIAANILKRYLRLVPTIFFCDLFAWVLLKFKMLYYVPGTIINGIPLFSKAVENVSFFKVISDSLVTVFIRGSSFVTPFWTIKYEFLGFFFSIILANVFTHINFKKKIIVHVILFALFLF